MRNMELKDWPSFLAIQQNEAVNQYIRAIDSESVIKQKFAQRLIPWRYESGDWLTLVIETSDTKEFVGLIGFYCQDAKSQRAEVGYAIAPTMQGKGDATESLQAIIDWGRLQYSIHKYVAVCSSANLGSQKVLLKTGFIQEGTLVKHTKMFNNWVDDYLYGLLT
nr:GNAT family protein [Shewanella aestuarii]